MTVSNIGDLAASYRLRRDVGRIKTDVSRLSTELSTGISADLPTRLKGDFGPLASIESGLARMDSYQAVIAERKLIIQSQQGALQRLEDMGGISDTLLTLPESTDRTLITVAGQDALSRMTAALDALNRQTGGRSIFSGVATDTAAVADRDIILTAIEAEIALAGATTAQDVATIVVTWFSPGGGFDTVGYLGGPAADYDTRLSDSELAVPAITAEEEAIRQQFSALAMAALLGRDVLAGDLDEQRAFARISGEELLENRDSLVSLQAELGTAAAQADRASAEVQAQAEAFKIARADLIEVDAFDTAVQLQTAETQLQTVFTITSRLSRLSMTAYL